jgi:hypothetical protein
MKFYDFLRDILQFQLEIKNKESFQYKNDHKHVIKKILFTFMVSFCRKIVFLLFVFISIPISNAQIKGTIKDQNKQPLAYASIYIEGTSIGTVTNASGDYELELKEIGEYNITCQYVGYKKETFTIRYDGKPVTKHIVLTEDENILSELVITADREDPAYAIIRKAIKKRNYYKNHLKSYEADLYVKGPCKK